MGQDFLDIQYIGYPVHEVRNTTTYVILLGTLLTIITTALAGESSDCHDTTIQLLKYRRPYTYMHIH